MSVIAFCKNEPPPFPYTFVCLLCRMMIMQAEKENGGKKSYLHLLSPSFIRSVQKPRHHQAQRPTKICGLLPWIHELVVNVPHKGKFVGESLLPCSLTLLLLHHFP